jgi:hypothetical protein
MRSPHRPGGRAPGGEQEHVPRRALLTPISSKDRELKAVRANSSGGSKFDQPFRAACVEVDGEHVKRELASERVWLLGRRDVWSWGRSAWGYGNPQAPLLSRPGAGAATIQDTLREKMNGFPARYASDCAHGGDLRSC